MSYLKKIEFFNDLAERWDRQVNVEKQRENLRKGLRLFSIKPHERIVDIGCGTGNLTILLLKYLSDKGEICSIDISENMIQKAQKKIRDSRVKWFVCNAEKSLPVEDLWADRVFCYSVWPHFERVDNVIAEIRRVLKKGGRLYIWHTLPRSRINDIHRGAGDAVCNDVLIPAIELVSMLENAGFSPVNFNDDDVEYLVVAEKR